MKRKVLFLSLVILAVLIMGAWFYSSDKTALKPLDEQKVTVMSIETDIEKLGVEVTVHQAEKGGYPTLELYVINNTDINLLLESERYHYKEGETWSKCTAKKSTIALGLGVVRCPETIAHDQQYVEEILTNTLTTKICPWAGYPDTKYTGTYRCTIQVTTRDTEENVGTIVIHWTQENQ